MSSQNLKLIHFEMLKFIKFLQAYMVTAMVEDNLCLLAHSEPSEAHISITLNDMKFGRVVKMAFL